MARTVPELARFVHDALSAGRTHQEVHDVLRRAGWSEGEVAAALDLYIEGQHVPPVPRPQAFVSARDSFFYALMLVALLTATASLAQLGFWFIDNYLTAERRFARDLSDPLAWFIVFGALFVWIRWRESVRLASKPDLRRSAVRKWFLYVALFGASLVLLFDAAYMLQVFFEGQRMASTVFKGMFVALIAGSVLLGYRGDLAEDKD